MKPSRYFKTIPNLTKHIKQIAKSSMPQGLSKDGQIFWDFLCDKQIAIGNEPRELTRSNLIKLYKDDLAKDKPASKRFMEVDHGFIQWFFPLETKGVNLNAPIMKKSDHKILKEISDVKLKFMEHFLLFAEFMGLEYNETKGTFKKVDAKQWKSWIEHPHNNLRISRILISLKDFGLRDAAYDFLDFLKAESERFEDEVIERQTFRTFSNATRASYKDYWSHCL